MDQGNVIEAQGALYAKIFKIMQEISAVKRDKAIQTSKGSYNVTTYEAMLDVVRPKLIENGIVVVRTSAKSVLSGNICVVDAEYDLIDIATGAKIHGASIGAGHDLSDKHAGKAMTYSLKYFLRDLFLLCSTDDDPDTRASEANAAADMKARLSNEFVQGLVDQAVTENRITVEAAQGLKRSIAMCGEDKAELEKAREYIRSALGI